MDYSLKSNGLKKEFQEILVIDDDTDLCELMSIILSKEGYKVKTMRHFNSLNGAPLPDLIILDVLFAGKDGRTICKQLKESAETRHIPVLMYSAGTNLEQDAKNAGAEDFIAKPFEIKELVRKIKDLELNFNNVT